MKASTVAKKILKLYDDDPSKWCQSAFARTAVGIRISPLRKTAASFCLMGAAIRTTPKEKARDAFYDCFKDTVLLFNDKPGRTFAQIKRRLKQIAEGDK